MNLEQIISDFEYIEEWEDRYRYVIDLGEQLEPYPDEFKTAETKVQGCVSQVWLTSKIKPEENVIYLTGDSDAHIVRGLMAIVFAIFSNKSPEEILKVDVQSIFKTLGLNEHISPQRSNGLNAMVKRIQSDAQMALS
ncbi:MAG: SufE family protein [Rhodomicrobiaceae bacterium]